MKRSYCSGVLISISADTLDCSNSKGHDSTAIFDLFRLRGIRSNASLFSKIIPETNVDVAGVPSPAFDILTLS